MLYSRKQSWNICSESSFPFMIYLAKCFLFSDSLWYNIWLGKAAKILVRCDDIRIKPFRRIPSKKFFLHDDCICSKWETVSDIKPVLDIAIDQYTETERDYATDEEAIRFLNLWDELRFELACYLSSKNIFTKDEYFDILDKAIKRNSWDLK